MRKIFHRCLGILITAELVMESKIAFARWNEPFLDTLPMDDALNVASGGIDTATTLIWGARGVAAVAATVLLSMCARRLHREDYYGALITFIGALIAGASPYLSTALSLG
jgi:hypothetical protein